VELMQQRQALNLAVVARLEETLASAYSMAHAVW